jgi:hypothetical protein
MSVGVFVNVTQFVVVKSRFCCNTRFVEGTVHEKARLPFEDARFSKGDGVVCRV